MQRIVAELYAELLEGIVGNGVPVDGASGNFDLECEFTMRCDDSVLSRVRGWAVDVMVLKS